MCEVRKSFSKLHHFSSKYQMKMILHRLKLPCNFKTETMFWCLNSWAECKLKDKCLWTLAWTFWLIQFSDIYQLHLELKQGSMVRTIIDFKPSFLHAWLSSQNNFHNSPCISYWISKTFKAFYIYSFNYHYVKLDVNIFF